MVFGSREMVSGHRSMVLPGSDMPSALGLVPIAAVLNHACDIVTVLSGWEHLKLESV